VKLRIDGPRPIGLLVCKYGLDGRRVRTNSRGTTRALSFRDLAPLIVVDEESVISEASPIWALSTSLPMKRAAGPGCWPVRMGQ